MSHRPTLAAAALLAAALVCLPTATAYSHHAFAAENRYETVGKVYLGLEPDFAAVTL